MLKLFRKSNPSNIAILFLIALIVHVKLLFFPYLYQDIHQTLFIHPLSFFLIQAMPFLKENIYVNAWLGFFLMFANLLYLNHILCKHRIYKHYNYVCLLISIILTGLFPFWIFFSSHHIAISILLIVIDFIMEIYTVNSNYSRIFHLGFFIGIASLFYMPTMLMILFIIFSLILFTSFRWRDFFVLFFGLMLPFFFTFSILYLSDNLSFLSNKFEGLLPISMSYSESHSIIYTINILLIVLLTTYACIYFYNRYFKSLLHVRKFFNMFICMLAITILIGFLQSHIQKNSFVFSILPLSMTISYFIYNEGKRVWAEVLVGALFFWIFAVNIS